MTGVGIPGVASKVEFDTCFLAGQGYIDGSVVDIQQTIWVAWLYDHVHHVTAAKFENSVFVGTVNLCGGSANRCVFWGTVVLKDSPFQISNSIVKRLMAETPDCTVAHCNLLETSGATKVEGQVFGIDPRFTNPMQVDFRLMPNSPCIGTASDGGDIGVRYTPEMMELTRIALELRAKGMIKF